MALKLFGTQISDRAIRETQVHTIIETVGGIGWLALTLNGHPILGGIVWFITLEVEHIFALAAGKDA
jgi:hypothetical protein